MGGRSFSEGPLALPAHLEDRNPASTYSHLKSSRVRPSPCLASKRTDPSTVSGTLGCLYLWIYGTIDVKCYTKIHVFNISFLPLLRFLCYFVNCDTSWFDVVVQISRSIGDVYLKKAEFNREPLYAKFRVCEPFKRPILSSEPSISVHQLLPQDLFIILASDGLWEHLTNQEAVDLVQNHPCSGSARRLVKAALQEAAKKREMRYSDLKKIERGIRRHFHDDITVIVVFLNSNLVSRASSTKSPNISVKGGGAINLPSKMLGPSAVAT
ncbi:probable protein phosphatase 2C 79 [Olea europaea var. sylvestris]|uniref:probable protein phosphatase 2C 79 n=1 Tax=Olea europaea var. sylvestris TaxID=158386 RepID=UPI000C1CF5CB|nr:probable protein phosphatase 2C 79 [Olea europaea var. sylvestris]